MSNTRIGLPPVGRPDVLPSTLPSTSAIVRRALSLVAAWRNRREIVRLARLEDRLLSDIGVTRADVDWALMLPHDVDPTEALAHRVERRRAAERWARRVTAHDV